jgi:hypothetical protein
MDHIKPVTGIKSESQIKCLLLSNYTARKTLSSYGNEKGVYSIYTQGATVTQEDPRVPLPPPWRHMYGSWDDPQEKETEVIGHVWFENVETEEKTWYDPRLTQKALKERGVNIQEFKLV